MAGLNRDFVYVGIKGHVLALDSATGKELWRTKLKGADFVHVASDGRRLFASARGEMFCLDGSTGAILWQNRLAGMGLGIATVLPGLSAASGIEPVLAAQASRRQGAY
jgi:outer membrane protein assembly factor BamB